MHKLIAAMLAMLLVLPVALADQTASRLDQLFVSLKNSATSPSQADAISGEIWRTWLQHDNAEAEALMKVGIARMNQLALADAVAVFSTLIEMQPDFAEAWNKRATVYYMMGEFARSTDDVAETLRLEPRHFGALSGQGLIYLQLDRQQTAIEWFKRALAVNPFMDNIRQNIERIKAQIKAKVI